MFLLLAALAALGDARRHSRRHHRHSRNLGFHSRYKLFLTIWNRMFEGTVNFEQQKGEVLKEYKEKVEQLRLRNWTSLNFCLDDGLPPPEVAAQRVRTQIFKDSRRFIPDWKDQGVLPDPFDHPTEPRARSLACESESHSRNYGKHLRRIERVAMALHSLGPTADYGYAQSHYDVIAVCYFAAVRCKEISPEMAEAAAFALVRQAVDRGILSLRWMHSLHGVNDILLREVIGDLAPKDEETFPDRSEIELGAAAIMLGARPLDVQYFADVLQFGDYAPLFVVVHRVFMNRERYAARRKRFLFGRAKRLAQRMDGAHYSIREVRSTYRQAVKYFKANRQRLARAVQ